MEEHTVPVAEQGKAFPVDLTREEYVAYHLLVARTVGPLRGRRVQMLLTGLLCLCLLAAVAYGWFAFAEMDWLLLALCIALTAVSSVMWIITPHRLQKQAGRLYDESVESGYCYYGTVCLRPTEILKQGQETTTALPLNANTLFIEDKDMLVWLNRQSRALVLPARCLTAETAAAVRAAADRLPTQNRRFINRLIPLGQPPAEPQPLSATTLWEKQVRYTPEEYAALAKSRVVSHFWRRLPQLAGVSMMLAVVFGWSESSIWPCVLAFFAALAALTVLHLVLPYTRIPRSPQDLSAAQLTVSVTFTERGVKLREGDNFASVPWSAVEHVYDRGDYAEMLFHHQSVRIPKREIEDVSGFNTLLQQYWKNKK